MLSVRIEASSVQKDGFVRMPSLFGLVPLVAPNPPIGDALVLSSITRTMGAPESTLLGILLIKVFRELSRHASLDAGPLVGYRIPLMVYNNLLRLWPGTRNVLATRHAVY
jgi:hypothetical protein